ncbi:MAG: hypothetical protein KAH33_00150 [Candidatus Delongbacteria bacterium]|nr:hypothetical protein [Candidatus Delongbacteria bacterium]
MKPVSLNRVKIEDRIKCLILPFKDITGSYDPVEPKLETLLVEYSNSDFLGYKHKGNISIRDKNKDLFQSNYNIVEKKSNIPNDAKMDDILNSLSNASEYDLLVSGTVEQLKYGSAFEVQKFIVDVYLWGFWGILAHNQSENDRAALLEYNIKVYDFNPKKLISSWTIQGAAKSPDRDREKLVKKANINVTDGILVKLNEITTERFNIKPIIYYDKGDNYYEWKNKNH